MKQRATIVAFCVLLVFSGCNRESTDTGEQERMADDRSESTVTTYMTIEAALKAIREFDGSPENFSLPVSDEIQDPAGIAVAIITDAALAKGWEPAGSEQRDGYRFFRYKSWE